MTARFGRNKRRRAREQISRLEAELHIATAMRLIAKQSLAIARAEGMTEALRRIEPKQLERFEAHLNERLAEAMAPHLRSVAVQVFEAMGAAARERGRKYLAEIDLRTMHEPNREVGVLRASVPALEWNMVVW